MTCPSCLATMLLLPAPLCRSPTSLCQCAVSSLRQRPSTWPRRSCDRRFQLSSAVINSSSTVRVKQRPRDRDRIVCQHAASASAATGLVGNALSADLAAPKPNCAVLPRVHCAGLPSESSAMSPDRHRVGHKLTQTTAQPCHRRGLPTALVC